MFNLNHIEHILCGSIGNGYFGKKLNFSKNIFTKVIMATNMIEIF